MAFFRWVQARRSPRTRSRSAPPRRKDTNGQLPTERRHYGFIHLGKSRLSERPGWRDWDAGGVLLLGLSDGGRMLILDIEHRVGLRFAIHGRLSLSGGSAERSEYGMIPWTSQASLSLRFQM